MKYNEAGQRIWVQAFNASGYVEDDQANITCDLEIDGGSPIALGNPTQAAQKRGRYYYEPTKAQTLGHELKPLPQSSTSGVQVVGIPEVIYTTREAEIKAKTDLIGTGSATVSAPVSETGALDELVIGDDYSSDNGDELSWTVDLPDGSTIGGAATCFFGGEHVDAELAGDNNWLIEGTVSAGPTASQAVISFDLLRADTLNLVPGQYKWSAELRNDAGLQSTRVRSRKTRRVTLVKKQTSP